MTQWSLFYTTLGRYTMQTDAPGVIYVRHHLAHAMADSSPDFTITDTNFIMGLPVVMTEMLPDGTDLLILPKVRS